MPAGGHRGQKGAGTLALEWAVGSANAAVVLQSAGVKAPGVPIGARCVLVGAKAPPLRI